MYTTWFLQKEFSPNSIFRYQLEEVRQTLEEKMKKMLRNKDLRNKELVQAAQQYENEVQMFARRCLDIEGSIAVSLFLRNLTIPYA